MNCCQLIFAGLCPTQEQTFQLGNSFLGRAGSTESACMRGKGSEGPLVWSDDLYIPQLQATKCGQCLSVLSPGPGASQTHSSGFENSEGSVLPEHILWKWLFQWTTFCASALCLISAGSSFQQSACTRLFPAQTRHYFLPLKMMVHCNHIIF